MPDTTDDISVTRDALVRAANTAWQAGLAVVVAAGAGWTDGSVWKAAGIAAVAAGLSALKTLGLAYHNR